MCMRSVGFSISDYHRHLEDDPKVNGYNLYNASPGLEWVIRSLPSEATENHPCERCAVTNS